MSGNGEDDGARTQNGLPPNGPVIIRHPNGDRFVFRKNGVSTLSVPVASFVDVGPTLRQALRTGNFQGMEFQDVSEGFETVFDMWVSVLKMGEAAETLRCGGCSSETHTLEDCLQIDGDGRVQGCPVCNTKDHGLDACRRFSMYPESRKIDVLVAWRGNKPPYVTDMDWFEMLHRGVCENRLWVPDHLPWTPAFAKYQAKNLPQLQSELDTHKDQSLLPSDLATSSWAAACLVHGIYDVPG